ncbi:MAG: hypothetical protein KKB90_12055 [Actinobacteria bacterium]|nr:hypothetical protein [Actinomycetota bacterium]
MTWTDIHSHILPGFDDGASSDEEFLEMARIAVEGGTSVMVATPHYDLESTSFELHEVAVAVEDHNSLLRETGIPLCLIPGVEVRINAGLLQLAEKGGGLEDLCLGKNGKCILVELPLMDMPLATLDVFFHIQLRGIIPILAHPERNRYLVKHPSMVRDLVERGIEMQVNSGSLEGIFGKSAKRTAQSLLKENAARLVASDAHGSRVRTPDLSRVAGALDGLLGDGSSHIILEVNPGFILDGEKLVGVTGAPSLKSGPSRKRFWRRSG